MIEQNLHVLIYSNHCSTHWTFYSATSFLEKCKKVRLEKWFFKLGFFFLVNHFSRTRKKIQVWRTVFLEPDFSSQISQTRFLEPLFYTFLEKWLQIKWSTVPQKFRQAYPFEVKESFHVRLLLLLQSSQDITTYSDFIRKCVKNPMTIRLND